MKLLLTSAGVKNPSIHAALVDLLGKPIAECSALCISTAIYRYAGGPQMAYQFISGQTKSPMCQLGWKSLGVLEPTLLPFIPEEIWMADIEAADVLLVWGGDPLFLRNRMRESGLADLFGSLPEMVYVGISAGSMVATSWIGETYTGSDPPAGEDIKSELIQVDTAEGKLDVTFTVAPGLGLTDFAVLAHVGNDQFPENSLANAKTWASKLPVPLYAIDDQTAIKVIHGKVEVVSEGGWKLFD